MKTKYHEPSGADVYLKYVCPNGDCLDVQWVTLRESQTKNYKIVCDCCGNVYRPKRVKNISVQFFDEPQKPPPSETLSQPDLRFLKEAKKTLEAFGFTKIEAEEMIEAEYHKSKINNPATLVKNALDFFGGKDG